MTTLNELLGDTGIEWFQDDTERRAELGRDIMAAAYLRGDFVLSSGAQSSYYLDKYLFVTRPTVMRRIARLFGARVSADADRLAGPELGAVALAAVTSLETGLPFVLVRKSPKRPSAATEIEGELHPGERVVILEDIVSTGEEALSTAAKLRAAGAEVIGVLAVVDRQLGGGEAIAAVGISFEALFQLDELIPGRPT